MINMWRGVDNGAIKWWLGISGHTIVHVRMGGGGVEAYGVGLTWVGRMRDSRVCETNLGSG